MINMRVLVGPLFIKKIRYLADLFLYSYYCIVSITTIAAE